VATVHIARCTEHGLHGERTECFVCAGPVEQVPHLAWDHAHAAVCTLRERLLIRPATIEDKDAFVDAWTDALAGATRDLSDLGTAPDAPPAP